MQDRETKSNLKSMMHAKEHGKPLDQFKKVASSGADDSKNHGSMTDRRASHRPAHTNPLNPLNPLLTLEQDLKRRALGSQAQDLLDLQLRLNSGERNFQQ